LTGTGKVIHRSVIRSALKGDVFQNERANKDAKGTVVEVITGKSEGNHDEPISVFNVVLTAPDWREFQMEKHQQKAYRYHLPSGEG